MNIIKKWKNRKKQESPSPYEPRFAHVYVEHNHMFDAEAWKDWDIIGVEVTPQHAVYHLKKK